MARVGRCLCGSGKLREDCDRRTLVACLGDCGGYFHQRSNAHVRCAACAIEHERVMKRARGRRRDERRRAARELEREREAIERRKSRELCPCGSGYTRAGCDQRPVIATCLECGRRFHRNYLANTQRWCELCSEARKRISRRQSGRRRSRQRVTKSVTSVASPGATHENVRSAHENARDDERAEGVQLNLPA